MRKLNKEDRHTFFAYYGWTIPVFLIAFWAMYYFIFNQIYATQAYQQLVFFYAAYGVKDNSIHTKLQKKLEPKQCYEVNHYDYSKDSQDAYQNFTAVYPICDFFVFSKTDLVDMDAGVKTYFKPITDDLIATSNIPASYTYYSFETVNYAIKIYDSVNDTYNSDKPFSKYLNFSKGSNTDDFYLLIGLKSVNFNETAHHTLGYLGLDYLFNELN